MIRSRSHSPSRRKGEPHRRKLARCTLVGLALFVAQISGLEIAESRTIHKPIYYKQYAFIQLNHSFTEFYCLDELWFRESRWDHRADNPRSSAFGIPQILGLKTKDPIKQIDRGLAYIKHRYLTACNALAFHNRKGWY